MTREIPKIHTPEHTVIEFIPIPRPFVRIETYGDIARVALDTGPGRPHELLTLIHDIPPKLHHERKS